MNKNASTNESSSFNTTRSGMWENERKVCEIKASKTSAISSPSSAAATSPSTMTREFEAKKYLPEFIVRRFGDDIPILIDSCQLKSKFKAKHGILEHRYTVSWIEDGPIHQEIEQMSLTTTKAVQNPSSSKNGMVKKASKIGDCPKVSKVPKTPKRKCCTTAAPQKELSPQPCSAKKELSTITLKSEHSQTSPSREVLIEVGNNTKECQPNIRKCDGPCAQMRAITDLKILGRCEHAICSLCVINAPMVPSDDGSMGCCNKRCFAGDLINQIPDSKRRHELYSQIFKNQKFEEIFKLYKGDIRRAKMPRKDLSSQYSNTSINSCVAASTKSPSNVSKKSASSNSSICSEYQSMESLNNNSDERESLGKSSGKYDVPPADSTSESEKEEESAKMGKPSKHELLIFRLVILESSYFSTIKRHRFEDELEAKMPLLAAVEELMGVSAARNLSNSTTRIFYCPNETMNTESMLEMNAKEHGTLTLGQLATIRGKIHIVIDYTGKILPGKRQPFTKSSLNGGTSK